ncbi:MAG: HD-GYP domain-containing protein [Lachnospiraceae bacterium]|nr:HD-GYP domain-containing protein [Lachnospiraceae bacterium]
MNRVDNVKKAIKYVMFSLIALTAIVGVLFLIHVVNVNNFNNEWNTVTPNSSATSVLVNIHPRGGVTDSWEKINTGLDTNLNAKIYEMTVTNNAKTYVEDWFLRINVRGTCYLNNGWCGKFEVHQFEEDGKELSQTIDLRDYKIEDIFVKYLLIDQDLLIILKKGDYIIYHPDSNESSGEVPIKGTEEYSGSCACGIIMYSVTGDIDFSDYEMSYRLRMSVWEGTKGRLFIIGFSLIVISFLIIGTVFLVSVHFEGRLENKDKILADTFKICCSVSDSRDYYSKGHSERVAEYSRMIAEKMGMDKGDCDIVYNAALLHNIGNVFVDEKILRKSGKLTGTEFAEVKTHTTHGAEILKELENIPMAVEAALCHHERYDGKGYPKGLKEGDIPLVARIIAVADAYDAMNNDRPYRNKLLRDNIREEFINNRGLQFDPTIVTTFLDIMGERNL